MVLQPITLARTPRFREAAYDAIKEAILARQFEPGTPLVEEQIAASLEISRTPVREALAILEHEGLISLRNARGLYVRQLTRQEFIDMFTANEVIEPYLARQAALLATAIQCYEIEAAIERGIEAGQAEDMAGLLRSGRNFHMLVGQAADNQPLMRFVSSNEERADLYLLSYHGDVDTTVLETSNQEHAAILQAIKAHDPESAARLMIYHSQSVRTRLSNVFTGLD